MGGNHVCEASTYKYASLGVSDEFCSQCTSKGWCKGLVDTLCAKVEMSLALEDGKAKEALAKQSKAAAASHPVRPMKERQKPKSQTRERRTARFLGRSFVQKLATRKRGRFLEEGTLEL